ncbi:MAG: hypothetical protein ACI4TI_01045 [Christensenellales bacterium]
MDLQKKEFINSFVLNKNTEEFTNFNLVLNKLNDFLLPFLDKIVEENHNEIAFKINLIGDHFLQSNYDYLDSATIMIEYYTNSEAYNYSKKSEHKSEIGKLLSDSFQSKTMIYPTIENLLNRLYTNLSLNTKDLSIFKRKNGISLKLFDFKFFIFFFNKYNSDQTYDFSIKGKNYSFNFDLMHKNLLEKNAETNGRFFELVKFFKITERELQLIDRLYLNASKTIYFYENLLYSLPNKLFENNYIFDNFLACINYLSEISKNDSFDELSNAEGKPLFVEDEFQLFAKYYITKYDIKLVLKQEKIFVDKIDEIIKID